MTFNPFANKSAPVTHYDIAAEASKLQAEANKRQIQKRKEAELKQAIRAEVAGEPLESRRLAAAEEEDKARKSLSRLVDPDFPYDESQVQAIEGMAQYTHAGLTGAAGTGKTTVLKAVVDKIQDLGIIGEANIGEYWHKDDESKAAYVPAICILTYTGKSSQMVKKNFPDDWHGNILTIHRALGYAPEMYEDFNDEGQLVTKRRFVPSYTANHKMPWDVIVIDEAGMPSMDLWIELKDAMKEGCRVYMVGDINQLPPIHGRSPFGFALALWPSFELTHIHRQKGDNNKIVDAAWSILQGRKPESGGNFLMVPLKGAAGPASRQVRAIVQRLVERKAYDPFADNIIVPINGETRGRGFQLGQVTLNEQFSHMFNDKNTNQRIIIDAGRDMKRLAVGDRVMATKNDHDIGITNGMQGQIVDISDNGQYTGDANRVGPVEDVEAYISGAGMSIDTSGDIDFDLDSMDFADFKAPEKEKGERGPASHIVTVDFGTEAEPKLVEFATLAEVYSLQISYAVTCHKMQGAEADTIIVVLHSSHKGMLNREWLYTAVTRAAKQCILLYDDLALQVALRRQRIKGSSMEAKIAGFMGLLEYTKMDEEVNRYAPYIPASYTTSGELYQKGMGIAAAKPVESEPAPAQESASLSPSPKPNPFAKLSQAIEAKKQPAPTFKITVANESKGVDNETPDTNKPKPVANPFARLRGAAGGNQS